MASVPYQHSPVTIHYARTGLNIANTFLGGGDIAFQLNCFQLVADNPNFSGSNYVVNNTFKITVHYSDEFDFMDFNVENEGIGQIALNWENNNTPGNVLIATNSTDNFEDPVNGTSYNVGDALGTAEIIYYGNAGSFIHDNVSESSMYYYKAWPVDVNMNYGSGLSANIYSAGNVEFPIIADFNEGIPAGWTTSSNIQLYNWEIGTNSFVGASQYEGTNMIRINKRQPGVINANLITNPIIFSGLNYTLSFWVYRFSTNNNNDKLSVYVSDTNSTDNASLVKTIKLKYIFEPAEASAGWYNYTVDLSEYGASLGAVKYIIFNGYTSATRFGSVCLDLVKIENLPDFPQNEETTIDDVVIHPNVNLYYNHNMNANNPIITSLPNYENLGNKRVIGLTGYDNDIDVQVTAPAGNWYGRIYYAGSWHDANPRFIAEGDGDRIFTFEGVDFTAKDGEVFVFLNDGEDITLPVELSSFSATATASEYVTLNWETESESNLLGYNVYRSETENFSQAMRINTAIISATNQSQTSYYTYKDNEIESTSYYYWLEVAELANENSFHGPIAVTVEDEIQVEPINITQFSNFGPSPFSYETSASIRVKEGETATVTIYNLKGQVVTSEIFSAGEHEYIFKGRDRKNNKVANGVYFVRMTSPSTSKSFKIVKIK